MRRSSEGQKRNGRRGAVFSVRLTDEERELLEAARAARGGPRRLGPWLLWRALSREVLPAGGGTTKPVLPELGYYPAGAVVPAPAAVVPAPANAPRAVLPGPGTTRAIADRVVLDLCAGSGSWSAPYEAAGYRVVRVTLPEDDVRTFIPPAAGEAWGILAAPPCDQFSLARNGHDTPRDFVRGMETVNACVRIIAQCAPQWWALENPVGLLSRWLGTPRDVFEPCDFGDPWTKRTAIWGRFNIPRRGPFVEPVGGGPLCAVCDPERRRTTWCNSAAHRAVTPPGFARAFFEANP